MAAGAKQDGSPTLLSDPVAMGSGNTLDQTVQTEAPQVIRHLSRGDELGCVPDEGSPVIAEFAVGKTPRQQSKHQQGAEQSLHQWIGETQGAGPLTINHRRFIHLAECFFADSAIVAEFLDVQKT